jgi:hypothetical protein
MEVPMARRQPEEVVNVLINRKTHARLRILQTMLGARTLSDALEKALDIVYSVNLQAVVSATRETT